MNGSGVIRYEILSGLATVKRRCLISEPEQTLPHRTVFQLVPIGDQDNSRQNKSVDLELFQIAAGIVGVCFRLRRSNVQDDGNDPAGKCNQICDNNSFDRGIEVAHRRCQKQE